MRLFSAVFEQKTLIMLAFNEKCLSFDSSGIFYFAVIYRFSGRRSNIWVSTVSIPVKCWCISVCIPTILLSSPAILPSCSLKRWRISVCSPTILPSCSMSWFWMSPSRSLVRRSWAIRESNILPFCFCDFSTVSCNFSKASFETRARIAMV